MRTLRRTNLSCGWVHSTSQSVLRAANSHVPPCQDVSCHRICPQTSFIFPYAFPNQRRRYFFSLRENARPSLLGSPSFRIPRERKENAEDFDAESSSRCGRTHEKMTSPDPAVADGTKASSRDIRASEDYNLFDEMLQSTGGKGRKSSKGSKPFVARSDRLKSTSTEPGQIVDSDKLARNENMSASVSDMLHTERDGYLQKEKPSLGDFGWESQAGIDTTRAPGNDVEDIIIAKPELLSPPQHPARVSSTVTPADHSTPTIRDDPDQSQSSSEDEEQSNKALLLPKPMSRGAVASSPSPQNERREKRPQNQDDIQSSICGPSSSGVLVHEESAEEHPAGRISPTPPQSSRQRSQQDFRDSGDSGSDLAREKSTSNITELVPRPFHSPGDKRRSLRNFEGFPLVVLENPKLVYRVE